VKIKKIKQLKINSYDFNVIWEGESGYGSFSWLKKEIKIGIEKTTDNEMLEVICHELMELCAVEMHVRYSRTDCDGDYIFVYDHRQHDTMMNMFAGLLSQFIK